MFKTFKENQARRIIINDNIQTLNYNKYTYSNNNNNNKSINNNNKIGNNNDL